VSKVITDVLRAADRGEVSLLCMLDLSAAFDTVDHEILIERLQQSFGVQGLALSWIESFLRGRSQAVSLVGELSSISLQQSVSIKCLHGGDNGMHQRYRIVLLDSIHTNVLQDADMCFRIVVGDVSTVHAVPVTFETHCISQNVAPTSCLHTSYSRRT